MIYLIFIISISHDTNKKQNNYQIKKIIEQAYSLLFIKNKIIEN